MSGVVLRCPNCGTTKAATGECEACHEAQVRYFCTNHTPGRWLETPACPSCGARFGEAAPRPRAAPPPPAAPARAPGPATPAPVSAPRRKTGSGGPWGGRGRSPRPAEASEARGERATARSTSMSRLPEVLARAAARARRAPPAATHVPGELPAAGPAFGGCLARALLLVMFLLITFVAMTVLFGGPLLQVFLGYY